ncbi:MAG TPA: GNAT family N-acetyltransferase [Thermoanaerobaculia bacterium]|nr:GNAT family N-acetyltransferase [Thermoanaerobaculia bacterium]
MPLAGRTPAEILRTGKRVYLRHPIRHDAQEFLAMVRASRRYHRPWVYPPDTQESFALYTARAATDRSFYSLIFLRETDELIGAANLSEIVRGLFRSTYLGYYGHVLHSGQGLMREGVGLLLRHAFQTLKLHRIEANIQPGNTSSLHLVRALGFHKEGFSPKYLKIGGKWRDHERWALLVENWSP